MMRTLYFDIDGVLLCYNDIQRPVLSHGALENKLKSLHFDRLICVSGWSDIVNSGIKTEQQQKNAIHELLSDIFQDKDWFIPRLQLVYDTDHRCQHIQLHDDWYYVDDWADKFFPEVFGQDLYEKENGNRILLVNPHGNGKDILNWLEKIKRNID